MSVDSDKEIIFKVLDNGIYYLSNEKKNLNDNLNELNEYLSQYLINLPTESNELQKQISAYSKKINENFYKVNGLLKNVKNRASKLFSNIFINIDTPNLKNKISDSLIFSQDITFSIAKVKSEIDIYISDNPINKFSSTLLLLPSRFKKVYSQILALLEDINTNISMTIHQLNNVVDYLLEIENKVHNYSNIDYKKRFEEDTNLLLKQFENQISNLVKTYENQVKVFNLEIKDSTDTVRIAKENLEDIELKNSELSSKLAGYERRLQQIADSRTEDIQYILEEKLVELERINNDKISVIDNSYEKAQTNYQKFKDLVEKAGVYNLITNYKKKAEDEQEEYKKYRDYTTNALYGAIGFTILILGIPLVEHWGDTQPVNIDYYPILVRLTISLMFLVLALFFSKQAAKHYECHQENNRTYLQLAALEPFMANMSAEDQLAIRKQLIPTYFNQNADGKFASKGDEVDISTNMHNLLSQVISVVAEKKDPKSSTNSSESNTSAK
ncbi:hypothetical protein NCY62_14825 [Acinetobacter pittii]|uniref:hypothetical protein n=1 Tax=Acinetobacter pittii TaxID=48296 RepID=UPI00202FDEEC|nr:hypothetical protein [Acinetobacter pittii]MCM1963378.1 hypothetical protein [Acinetobacter pittii]MCM1979756.1 hypothetical protein [Acinetobacter pittii]